MADYFAMNREQLCAEKAELEKKYPDLKQKIFGAMQRYPLRGWETSEAAPAGHMENM